MELQDAHVAVRPVPEGPESSGFDAAFDAVQVGAVSTWASDRVVTRCVPPYGHVNIFPQRPLDVAGALTRVTMPSSVSSSASASRLTVTSIDSSGPRRAIP